MEHKELTEKIIGCAMKVHTVLGNGFPEIIYQKALAIELTKANLEYEREFPMDIFYDGNKVGNRRVDFFIEKKVITELKATKGLDDGDLNQAINYLEAYNLPFGLLINFGCKSLEFKRPFNKKYKNSSFL